MGLPGIQYFRSCPDPRTARGSRRRSGRLALDPLTIPSASRGPIPQIIHSYVDPDDTDHNYFLPTVISASDMPYTDDDEGGSWPAGTMFVVPRFDINALPVTGVGPYFLNLGATDDGWTQRYIIVTVGLPAGSTGTFVFTKTIATTALATGTITGPAGSASDTLAVAEVPTFAGFDSTTDTVQIDVTWSAGAPTTWMLCAHPYMRAAFAVPSSLPTGWTARSGAQHQFARALGSPCDFDWPGRAQFATTTPANAAINPSGGFWIPETLQFYNFFGAFGRTVPTVSQVYAADIPAVPPIPPFFPGIPAIDVPPTPDVTLLTNGTRKLRLKVSSGGLLPTASFTYKIVRSDTGATVANPTYTAAQIQAGVDDSFGDVTASPPGPITFTLSVTDNSPYYGVAPTATLIAHMPILPFPVNAGNPEGEVAPGGIVYAQCTDALTDALTVLAAGVVTGSASGGGYLAFTIEDDGWYQVLSGLSPATGVGENEFDYSASGPRTADRGRAGRLFYGGAGGTLTAFVPSFTAILSAGSTLTTTQGGVWDFRTIALPAAGTYEVSLVIANRSQLLRGLVMEWSATDTLCINPDGREIWESWSISETWTGLTQTTPPGSPTDGQSVIVADGGSGAFLGHDGEVAVYNAVMGAWNFIPTECLEAGMYVSNGGSSWSWYDGSAWKASTDPVITRLFTVDAATTLYCTFGAFSQSGAATPHVTASWAAVP